MLSLLKSNAHKQDLYTSMPSHSKQQHLKIQIKSRTRWDECDFWIVFYRRGTLSNMEVVNAKTFTEIFQNVIHHGIDDNRPLMYVDTSVRKGKSLHLLFYPESLFTTEDNREMWLENLVSMLIGTYPKALGLYFSEEIFAKHDMKRNFARFIDRLMAENVYLNHLTLLAIFQPFNHLLQSAEYAKEHLNNQYSIFIDTSKSMG
ncbi:MAG: hypothetical protein OXC44_00605 [Proteobacteria bacterium]|nr:hypothetical protein [Pseudomonadota bacterium]